MTWRGLFDWALAFALTQAIEVPIYVAGARLRPGRAFAASAITHPVAWFVAPRVWRAAFVMAFGHPAPTTAWRVVWAVGYVALAEGWAVSTEAWWLRRSGCARPWRWSLAANGASAATGFAIDAVAGGA